MPSLISIMLREQIRLLKPLIDRASIETARAFQEKLGEIEMKMASSRVMHMPVSFDPFEACMVSPKFGYTDDKKIILYLHGGGYVAGHLQYACGFASVLAKHIKRPVLAVAYRLAPEHPFPAALEDAYQAYCHCLERGYRAEDIVFVGESAGGGLIFSLCLYAKAKGKPLPSALISISPWADLTFQGKSYTLNSKKDPVLSKKALVSYAKAYAKDQEHNDLVSPALADLDGFPRTLIFAGGDELLLDDSKMLAAKLIIAGGTCELIIEEGLWHVYVLYKIPEAKQAMERILQFLGMACDESMENKK